MIADGPHPLPDSVPADQDGLDGAAKTPSPTSMRRPT